jgi:hypothetical protein
MNSTPSEMSIGAMAGKLPYNHLVFKGEDPRAKLVGMCFQVLSVLLDFQSGTAKDRTEGPPENQTSTPTPKTNSFRYFLMKLVGYFRGVIGIRFADWWFSTGHKTLNLYSMDCVGSCCSKCIL